MELSMRFAVQPLPAVDAFTPTTARVIVDGQASNCVLTGEVLEAAIAWEDKFVLVLSDGVIWEEGLNIHLLGPDLVAIDSLTMGWPYTPGIFTELNLLVPDAFTFSFPGETQWRVRMLKDRRLAMPRPAWFPGISRPARWWRWLELTQLSR